MNLVGAAWRQRIPEKGVGIVHATDRLDRDFLGRTGKNDLNRRAQ
jgi:hypothetical protein